MLSKSEAHWHLPRWKVYFLLQLLAAAQKLLNQSLLPSPAAMSDFKQRWGLDTVWKINSESGVLSKMDFHLCGKSWGGDHKKSTIFFCFKWAQSDVFTIYLIIFLTTLPPFCQGGSRIKRPRNWKPFDVNTMDLVWRVVRLNPGSLPIHLSLVSLWVAWWAKHWLIE